MEGKIKEGTTTRALSVDNIVNLTFKEIPFSEDFADLLGDVELAGSWIAWGGSGCGKTSFALQLAKELCTFEKVLYNSLEEGKSKSLKKAVLLANMQEVSKRITFLNKESMEDLKVRLRRRKCPHIVITDSVQYTRMKLDEYIDLRKEFPRVLFVWISHEKNKEPDGRLAEKIRYDSDVKIHVEGYRAFPLSRMGGGKPYTIWEEGALDYYGLN